MSAVIIFIIFILLCFCYGYPRVGMKNSDKVYSASAGSSDEQHESVTPIFTEESTVIQLPDGTYANTKSFHRLRINGSCMSPLNMNNGDEWLAVKIDHKKNLRDQIKIDDVLLIHLADKNSYKIRKVKGFINDTTLDTYSYNQDKTEHKSSKPHTAKSIMGVVKYRLSKGA